ncbi:MAG TPA: FAD-dependent oxidoreductase [Bacillota bacterium]|nr:FAD-dependent oxidoreductase [Bacillota bacterium]
MENARTVTYRREIPVEIETDVFVAGGGPAGVAAAIAAARFGARVFIAEQTANFGGAATNMLIPCHMQFGDGENFLAAGIGKEIYDYMKEHAEGGYKKYTPPAIPVELYKRCCDELVAASGADFMFYTTVIDAVRDGSRIDYVVCVAKGQMFAARAKIYIDCTGDGELSALAGAECEYGDEHGRVMAATLCSIWAGIDWPRVVPPDSRELERAFADGVFTNIDRHLPGMFRLSEGEAPGLGVGGLNGGHIYDVDARSARSLTRGIIAARRQLDEYKKYYREYLTGFENSHPVISAPYLGIRESRRVMGEYVMTLDDFLSRASFEDEIGRYAYPVDIHSPTNDDAGYRKFADEHQRYRYKKGESYGIPYRALVVRGIDNLLVAGRCISADRYIQSSIRVIPGCYITGQAAGVGASVAAESGKPAREADYGEIRKRLEKLGAYL